MANLGNCPRCRKLFLRIREICDDCYQKQETDYLLVSDYLHDHPNCTMQQLSDETKVSVSQIRQFILANRILVNYFANLSYPCDTCGIPIRKGKTCSSCIDTISRLASQVEKKEIAREFSREQKKMAGSYKLHTQTFKK